MAKSAEYYIQGVLKGDRLVLSRTITLVESRLTAHRELANKVIDALLPKTGGAVRLGITGVPGAGKSVFIESFGTMLTSLGMKVAVLAIDPSSSRSGGSILGDKTRMGKLAVDAYAFIRPSPSGGTLGGVAGRTRESMLVCEAAGFDVVIIETVGVGQSELSVASMVDFFLVLLIAGAGDELQGIKKGVLEVADGVVINKADGDNKNRAKRAQKEYQRAMHLLMAQSPNWQTPVLTCSALKRRGLKRIWQTVQDHTLKMKKSGEFSVRRKRQERDWFSFLLEDGLRKWFYSNSNVKEQLTRLMSEINTGKKSATAAASELLALL